MLRWLYNFVCALSLFLAIATCVLWVRSYWVADAWGWARDKTTIQWGVARGRLRIDTTQLGEEGGTWPAEWTLTHSSYAAAIDPPTTRLPTTLWNLGFATEHRVQPRNFDSRLIIIPLWLPALILFTLAWRLHRHARMLLERERLRAHHCPTCNYDLRATPDRCPECGRVLENRA